MSPFTLNLTAWVLWIVIGVVVGLVASRMGGLSRYTAYNVVVGLVGSLAGGLCSYYAIGDASMQLVLISALVAAMVAVVVLWLFYSFVVRNHPKSNL